MPESPCWLECSWLALLGQKLSGPSPLPSLSCQGYALPALALKTMNTHYIAMVSTFRASFCVCFLSCESVTLCPVSEFEIP